ncbi:MAG TPA: hypothetical protein VFE23_17625 [Usitatibacter sp.]|nr:hypothetical protein [Usitatibacter sp.]
MIALLSAQLDVLLQLAHGGGDGAGKRAKASSQLEAARRVARQFSPRPEPASGARKKRKASKAVAKAAKGAKRR